MSEAIKNQGDDAVRARIKADFVEGGVVDQLIDVLRAAENLGSRAVDDIHPGTLYFCIKVLTLLRDNPGCKRKLRDTASSLHACIKYSRDWIPSLSVSTGVDAARLAVAIFGRDESDEFVFTQTLVDSM